MLPPFYIFTDLVTIIIRFGWVFFVKFQLKASYSNKGFKKPVKLFSFVSSKCLQSTFHQIHDGAEQQIHNRMQEKDEKGLCDHSKLNLMK